jgi:hypothetical protein
LTVVRDKVYDGDRPKQEQSNKEEYIAKLFRVNSEGNRTFGLRSYDKTCTPVRFC